MREKIPFFIFSIVFSVLTIYAQRSQPIKDYPFSLGSRIANAPVSFMTYLEKTFWPHDLAVIYPFSEQLPLWQVAGATLLILVISAAVIVAVKRLPYLFTGWLWYFVTILPVIGIIQVGDPMADRYIYLPSIGIYMMLAWGVPSLIKNEEIRKKILFPAAIAILAILAVSTWRQCGYWENSASLFNHALQVTKDNYLAYNARGVIYAKSGRYQSAIEDFGETIRLQPAYANAYYNRGLAYANSGQYEHAIRDYNETSKLQPGFADIYFFRGTAYGELGQYQPAIESYNEAIRLRPDYIFAYYNRGVAYGKLHQFQRSVNDFNETIRLKQDYADAYNGRGIAYLSLGDKKLGCPDARKACELGNCRALELAIGKGDCR